MCDCITNSPPNTNSLINSNFEAKHNQLFTMHSLSLSRFFFSVLSRFILRGFLAINLPWIWIRQSLNCSKCFVKIVCDFIECMRICSLSLVQCRFRKFSPAFSAYLCADALNTNYSSPFGWEMRRRNHLAEIKWLQNRLFGRWNEWIAFPCWKMLHNKWSAFRPNWLHYFWFNLSRCAIVYIKAIITALTRKNPLKSIGAFWL